MNLGRLNHVGVATPSIEQSLELYRNMFNAEPHGPAFDLPAQGVRVCFVDTPNSQIELIEPLGANSPIVKFLGEEPTRRPASCLLRSPRHPRRQGRVRSEGRACPRRAAHRRARDARLLRPSQGHGRRADGDHGDAEGGALRCAGFCALIAALLLGAGQATSASAQTAPSGDRAGLEPRHQPADESGSRLPARAGYRPLRGHHPSPRSGRQSGPFPEGVHQVRGRARRAAARAPVRGRLLAAAPARSLARAGRSQFQRSARRADCTSAGGFERASCFSAFPMAQATLCPSA